MNLPRTLAALALCLCAFATANVRAAEASGVKVDVLMQSTTSWDGVPYAAYPAGQTELTMLRITIAPHTTLPWHTHPMPNAAYVLSGELTVEKAEGGLKRQLVAGDVLPETVNSTHRGYTGDQPVVLLVFYAGAQRVPLSRPAE
ncbi:MAG: cupin [Burkholderiales bacterium 28-67-8]|nr:MAG: cupin [Burkholderiales bacterium 28-67-8]